MNRKLRSFLSLGLATSALSASALNATLTLHTPNITIDVLNGGSPYYVMHGRIVMNEVFNGFALWIPYVYRVGGYQYRNDYTIEQSLLTWLSLQMGQPGIYDGPLFRVEMDPSDIGGLYNHPFYSLTEPANCYVYINGNNQDRSNEVPYTINLITPGRVTGTVNLEQWSGDPQQYAYITVRQGTSETYYFEQLDANGQFTVETGLSGSAEVLVSVAHWLRGTSGSITLGQPATFSVSLVNGDVDGDNVISVFDYIQLSDAFDSVPGDESYNPSADLDGDEVVSVFDYIILSDNFDKQGAE